MSLDERLNCAGILDKFQAIGDLEKESALKIA